MMPLIRKQLHLDPLQASIAVAVPVLLGSLGRIPLGMLTDGYGGRVIFSAVMAFAIIPAIEGLLPQINNLVCLRALMCRTEQLGFALTSCGKLKQLPSGCCWFKTFWQAGAGVRKTGTGQNLSPFS